MSPEGIDPQEAVYGDTYKPRKKSMTTQSNAELREAIAQLIYNGYIQHREGASYDDLLEKVNALFQSQQQQLLQGLMEQHVIYHYQRKIGEGYFKAVPLEVIQNKLEGLQ